MDRGAWQPTVHGITATKHSIAQPQNGGFPGGSVAKNPPAKAGDVGLIPDQEGPLEDGMLTYYSILA